MFDPRLYRTSLLIVLVALMAAAFSLQSRPAPVTTTVAPDTFNTIEAEQTLRQLTDRFPDRRPGSIGDDSLAREVLARFQAINAGAGQGGTAIDEFRGDTIDGNRELKNVSLTRPGEPGAPIVVVAHRDAAGSPAVAELSATAVLLELARVAGGASFKRTVIFVSTSGGSGGLAGARRLAEQLADDKPSAVLVIGDVASRDIRKPTVVGWSNGKGQAPIRLQRSLQAAVLAEAGEAGASKAPKQWGRMAFPLTTGEQGAFNREGIPSVLLQVSGERGPGANDPVSRDRLQSYGRAALRMIYALNGTEQDFGPPEATLVAQRKLIPYWAIQGIVGALLLVPLIVSLDGYARLRRRSERVGRWSVWTLSWSLPFVIASLFVILLHLVGLIDVAPPAPISGESLKVDSWTTVGIVSIFVVFALTLVFVRPLVLKALAPDTIQQRPSTEGAAMGVMLVMSTASLVAWGVNAYAAALLVPAAHLWLLALSPQARLRRRIAIAIVLLSFSPLVILALIDASAFGWSFEQLLWSVALLIAGGHASIPIWLLSSLLLGCLMSALVVATRLERARVVSRSRPRRRLFGR